MELTKAWLNRQIFSADIKDLDNAKQTLDEIMDVISICNRNTTIDSSCPFDKFPIERRKSSVKYKLPIQKTTDSVLLDFVRKSKTTVDERNKKSEIIFEMPYTPTRRFHLAVVLQSNSYLAMLKGAPEELIQNCSWIKGDNDTKEVIDANVLAEFEANYEQLSSEGNNCIGFASMEIVLDGDVDSNYEYLLESKQWCFLGMLSISEPVLSDIENAVKRADQAHIRLFLLSNDHPTNAQALAHQIGFYNQNSTASTTSFSSMESLNTSSSSYDVSNKSTKSLSMPIVIYGDHFNGMSQQEWTSVLKHKHIIFSRVDSTQKLELIKVSGPKKIHIHIENFQYGYKNKNNR
jgi:magnesium-transporting ATPase (P-type)